MAQNFPEVNDLVKDSENFLVPLRMRQEFDEEKFQLLCLALRNFAEKWKNSDLIPKLAANILVDLYPALDSVSYLYPEEEGNKIRAHAELIGDLVRECVAI